MEIRPKASALSVGRRGTSGSSDDVSTGTETSTTDEEEEEELEEEEEEEEHEDDEVVGEEGEEAEDAEDVEEEEEEENGNENGGSSASSVTRSGRSSEDDVTLNEMMGKFDESYVYEKETDILSDSDPTDCEDCIESPSDAEHGRAVAAEDGVLDNAQLDYIDTGSFVGLDELERVARFPNTGRCSYFGFGGEPARRSGRLRDSLTGRRSGDADAASTARR